MMMVGSDVGVSGVVQWVDYSYITDHHVWEITCLLPIIIHDYFTVHFSGHLDISLAPLKSHCTCWSKACKVGKHPQVMSAPFKCMHSLQYHCWQLCHFKGFHPIIILSEREGRVVQELCCHVAECSCVAHILFVWDAIWRWKHIWDSFFRVTSVRKVVQCRLWLKKETM